MKKWLAIFLMLSMLLTFAACDSSSSSDADDDDEEVSEKDNNGKDDKDNNKKDLENISFEAITVVDNDECSIMIEEMEYDEIFGYSLDVKLKNKSEDVTYSFEIVDSSINGVQGSVWMWSEVPAGKTANESVYISEEGLTQCGFYKYSDIALTFEVCDAEDYTADPVSTETVHVYPYGEDAVETFTREAQSTDQVLVDDEYATVTMIGAEYDKKFGYLTVLFYLENKTDSSVDFSGENFSINDIMADTYMYNTLSPGMVGFGVVGWFDDDLEENDIDPEKIENIEFELTIEDYETGWDVGPYFKDTVTVTP